MGDTCVLIIHRNRLFREGLAVVLAQQHHTVSVVGSVAEPDEVKGNLGKLTPDVILLDLCPPGRNGIREVRLMARIFPGAKILVMGLTESESDFLACVEAGAAGCLSQEASLEDLFKYIHAVTAGEALCSPKVAGVLISRVTEAARERELHQALGIPNLTRRELEITALIEEGLSNKEIAARLRIEVPTVKNHIHNILEKLQLNGRREVARYARERGLLSSLR